MEVSGGASGCALSIILLARVEGKDIQYKKSDKEVQTSKDKATPTDPCSCQAQHKTPKLWKGYWK